MIVRKLRLQHGWSQEQLAEMSGLSVRTVQRIEGGKGAGLESYKSLAAVFEVNVSLLQEGEPQMTVENHISEEEKDIIEQVRNIKEFYQELSYYLVTLAFLAVVNILTNPNYLWVLWVALGWGIAIAYHALEAFEFTGFFSARWEKKQIEKRLGRKWEKPNSDKEVGGEGSGES